jgi:hypothetical protein
MELTDDSREPVPFVLPLDRETLIWLAQLSGGCDQTAAEIIASMLHDIRIDDEAAHATQH